MKCMQKRVPDIHEAQKCSFFMFCLIFFSHDVSRIRMILFVQFSIDEKNQVKVEKCLLVAELKLKMLKYMQKVTFSILTLPPGGPFEPLLYFPYLIYGTLPNKVSFIF